MYYVTFTGYLRANTPATVVHASSPRAALAAAVEELGITPPDRQQAYVEDSGTRQRLARYMASNGQFKQISNI